MIKKILITFFCLVSLLLYTESLPAGNLMPQPVDSEEFKRSMQEHEAKMRILKPSKHREMVEKAGGKITNCCSWHVELCDKGAGQAFKK